MSVMHIDNMMVEGGASLRGEVKISGSKNAALPCLAASLLAEGSVRLKGIPQIVDIELMIQTLQSLGVRTGLSNGDVTVNIGSLSHEIPPHLSKKFRGSTLLMGGLLARCGRVKLSGYGGCAIGKRPIDYHLDGFRSFGAEVFEKEDSVEISCSRLHGAQIPLEYPSVGATENLVIVACMAHGHTTITNMSVEPEVLDLVRMLKSMGAVINVNVKLRRLDIQGGNPIQGVCHRIITDRIEAGTYAFAAVMTASDIVIRNVEQKHLEWCLSTLGEMGASSDEEESDAIRVSSKDACLRPISIETGPYPGFPTDMHPQFTAMATKAAGTSHLVETVHDARFGYVDEMRKLGARISVHGNEVVINGPIQLHGANVKAPDIRGGASLLIAALAAQGTTEIANVRQIYRGYERIDEKFSRLGAKIHTF